MKAIIKFLLMILVILLMMPVIFPFWLIRAERGRKATALLTCRMLARAIGLRVTLHGELAQGGPVMLISNHCGYADIFALGAALPVSYTPKSDIRYWPLVGWCCALSGGVFIERKPGSLPKAQRQIRQGLEQGRLICLFAEGTTGDGNNLKPFKSGFFSLAEDVPNLRVQPLALRYVSRNGKPLDAKGRSEVAWFGDDALLPHLMRFLSWRSVEAEVHLLPAVTMEQFPSRKEMARHCEQAIGEALQLGSGHPVA